MVPNGAAYDNFPSFANNGTKTPPGGSTESAKYALGMVPADTFPAEWANYLFHGATAGITRLNSDTGSIKKEINTVLSNFNITPDATLNNQLLEALIKLKAEAALAAHPVGSLYWTASTENPATTFGGGTWTQIKDKFILAAGDTYSNGATGGSATVTLTENQIPSHKHSFTPAGSVSVTTNPTFSGSEHSHSYTPAGTISITTNPTFSGTAATLKATAGGTVSISDPGHSHGVPSSSGTNLGLGYKYNADGSGAYQANTQSKTTGITATFTGTEHSHSYTPKGSISGGAYKFTGTAATLKATAGGTISGGAYSFSGTAGTTGAKGGGQAHDNMPPYIVKYCWQRTA